MKVFVIVVGAILALMGVSCMGAGGALAAAVGTDGWIESDEGAIDTTTFALVSGVADIAAEDPDAAEFFEEFDLRLRVDVEAQPDDEVFIGVGRTGDVDAYLAGVQHEVVDDVEFDDLDLQKTLVPGTREASPPGDQSFWVEQVSGSGEQVLDWDIKAGSYRFVLMNADASEGVDVQGRFALKIPYVTQLMIGLLVAGGIVALVGVAMIILAARSSSATQAPPAPPPAPTTPPPTGESTT